MEGPRVLGREAVRPVPVPVGVDCLHRTAPQLLRGCGGDPRDSRCGAYRPPEVLYHAEGWERDSKPPRGALASPKASAGESVMGSMALYLTRPHWRGQCIRL